MRRHMSGWLIAFWGFALCGCQSWSQVGQGIPGGARVPPPGTGTYQVPSSYYNNGAAPKAGTVSTNTQTPGAANTSTAPVRTASAQALPSTGANVSTANWQVPSIDQMRSGINNSAAAAVDGASQRANEFVQSGTSRAAAAVDQYTSPLLASEPPQSTSPASRSLSDSSQNGSQDTATVPPLDWQPPQ